MVSADARAAVATFGSGTFWPCCPVATRCHAVATAAEGVFGSSGTKLQLLQTFGGVYPKTGILISWCVAEPSVICRTLVFFQSSEGLEKSERLILIFSQFK